jgi:hypothetical protein
MACETGKLSEAGELNEAGNTCAPRAGAGAGARVEVRLAEVRLAGVRLEVDMFGVWCLVAVSKCVLSGSTTVFRHDVLSIGVTNFNGCFDWLPKFSAILIGR